MDLERNAERVSAPPTPTVTASTVDKDSISFTIDKVINDDYDTLSASLSDTDGSTATEESNFDNLTPGTEYTVSVQLHKSTSTCTLQTAATLASNVGTDSACTSKSSYDCILYMRLCLKFIIRKCVVHKCAI